MFGDLHLNRPFYREGILTIVCSICSIFHWKFLVRILPQSSFPWGSTQARSEMTHRWLPLPLGQGRSGPKPAWVPKPHQPSWKRKRRVFRSKVGFSCNNSFKPVRRQIQSQIGPEIWKQSVLGDMSIVGWACRAMKLPREVAKFGVGSLAALVPAAKKKEGWREEGERIRHESHFNQDLSGGCSTSDCGRRWSQVLSCNAEKRMKTYFSNRILWNIIGFELTLAIQNIWKTGVEPARTRVMSKWLVFVWDCTQLFEWYHTSWESRPQPVSTNDRRYWHVFALSGFCFCSSDWTFKKPPNPAQPSYWESWDVFLELRCVGSWGSWQILWSWFFGLQCAAQQIWLSGIQDSSRFTSEKWAVWSTMWSEL